MTRRLRTAGVSRFAIQSKSLMTFETTPDELTHVAPPSRIAAMTSQPRSSPHAKPGTKFNDRVGDAGDGARPQSGLQLVARVLETEREQQQQHTDVRRSGDEVGAHLERDEAPVADGEPSQEVQGDGRDAHPVGDTGQDGQPMATAPSSTNASGVFSVVAARTEITARGRREAA